MCRHQGGTENFFIDAMKPKGLEVERSTVPTVLELSTSPESPDVQDPQTYPVKVGGQVVTDQTIC